MAAAEDPGPDLDVDQRDDEDDGIPLEKLQQWQRLACFWSPTCSFQFLRRLAVPQTKGLN